MTTEPKLEGITARLRPGTSLDIGPGWYDLVLKLDADLAAIDPNYAVFRCKEKFGGLRYSTRSTPGGEANAARFLELVAEAEGRSFKICEACGAPGVERQGGWTMTLCDEHSQGREAMEDE